MFLLCNEYSLTSEHEIPVISVCVNQYGEERYADIHKCECQNTLPCKIYSIQLEKNLD